MQDEKVEEVKSDGSAAFNLIAANKIGAAQPELKPGEPRTVTLAPEQVEEIHVDDYSLVLFSATRIEPLSISEIKQKFPEPAAGKVQSVMDRFVSVGLVHINKDGRYYSNYPHDFVNWGKYRYEADIVARNDAKVFQLVKDFFGVKDYWKDKAFFSIDAFFTPEQSAELREMFMQIKLKAKQFANDNAKAGKIGRLNFRRIKFFDMTFAFLLAVSLAFATLDKSYAGGSGLDPTPVSATEDYSLMVGGSGTDPWTRSAPECLSPSDVRLMQALDNDFDGSGGGTGGGGYDPTGGGTGSGGGGYDPTEDGGAKQVNFEKEACKLDQLATFVRKCRGISNEFCNDVRKQSIRIWRNLKKADQGLDI